MAETTHITVNDVKQPVKAERSSSRVNQVKLLTRKVWFWLIVVVVAAAAVSSFFYMRYQDAQRKVNQLSNPQEAAKIETQQLVDKVNKLAQLPSGETPTVATVSDVSKLKEQTFFADAQNGDKAIIYTQAKKAVLYRPSTGKIINIAPINIGASAPNTSQ